MLHYCFNLYEVKKYMLYNLKYLPFQVFINISIVTAVKLPRLYFLQLPQVYKLCYLQGCIFFIQYNRHFRLGYIQAVHQLKEALRIFFYQVHYTLLQLLHYFLLRYRIRQLQLPFFLKLLSNLLLFRCRHNENCHGSLAMAIYPNLFTRKLKTPVSYPSPAALSSPAERAPVPCYRGSVWSPSGLLLSGGLSLRRKVYQ